MRGRRLRGFTVFTSWYCIHTPISNKTFISLANGCVWNGKTYENGDSFKDDCKTAIYFQFASSVADAATIIIVNLYIRSFAKIDDVKMVNSIFIPTSIRLLHTRTLNFKCIQMYSTWSIPYICRSTVFKLHSVRIGMTIGSTTRASSLTETCEVCTFKTHILNQMLQKPDSICRLHRMNF